MEKEYVTKTARLAKKNVSSYKSNFIVFSFFLFLSFIFWYLNSLGKDIDADIKYPVRYTNIPGNSTLATEMPERLNLFLKGPGYSILKLKLSGKGSPVIVDFSKVGYKRVKSSSKAPDYYIVTSGLIDVFNSQLRSGCRITAVKPDTLFFSLSKPAR